MSDRERRIASNEAIYRQVNERIESLNRGVAEISDGTMHIVCECGDLHCADPVVVPLDKYEQIRSDATLFFVRPGHEILDIESVVETTTGYEVVRKRAGTPAEVAKETDPRT